MLAAMALQEALLLLSGQLTWQTGLPLHLCSLLGLLTLPALLIQSETLLNTLFFAGVPGALLALAFPAALATPWPRLSMLAFHILHAGLVCTPVLPFALGWRPYPSGALRAWGVLLAAACTASLVNRFTGGNYLFLSGPVAGTPLTWLYRWGPGWYQAALIALAGLVLALESAMTGLLCGRKLRNTV